MLKHLRQREAGFLGEQTPVLFETIEVDRRLTALDLAKFKDFESVHKTPVVCGSVDPTECRYFISGSVDGTLAIHDLEDPVHANGDIVTTYKSVVAVNKRNKPDVAHRFSIETASWYPFDTGMCLTSGGDQLLKIWDTNSMTPVDDFQFNAGVNDHCMSLCLASSVRCLVAVATQSTRIKLVDLKSGAASHVLKGHEGAVLSLQWSPMEEFKLASGGCDRRVLIWDVRRVKSVLMSLDMDKGKPNQRFNPSSSSSFAHRGPVKSVLFTPDGHHLVSFGADGFLRLWDSSSGRLSHARFDKVVEESGVNADRKSTLAISDAGLRSAIFCPAEDDIRVFDLYTGIDLLGDHETLKGHFQRVNFVCLHPWHHELYSGGNDRNLVVWTYSHSPRDAAYEQYVEEERRKQKNTGGGAEGEKRMMDGKKEEEEEGGGPIHAYMDSWSDYSDDDAR